MLKEIRYSVLIVSSNEKLNNAVTKYLSVCNCDVTNIAGNVVLAKRLIYERYYDIVIISAPVNEDYAIDFAINISSNEQLGIMYLARSEDYDEAYDKLHEYGIITLSKPLPSRLFEQSIKVIISNKAKFSEIKDSSYGNMTLKKKMEDIKLISEAKILLMDSEKYSEEEAHRYIKNRAMDLRTTKVEIAKEIISTYKK